MKLIPKIGLEIHAQINTKHKLFSFAEIGEVSLFDIGYPGTLPVLNEDCLMQGIKTALALKGKIEKKCSFDRKHYFYPDLPQGYQITQYYNPLMRDGHINIDNQEKHQEKQIRISHMHIEQDAAKIIHGYTSSEVNFARAGTGLMEIVTLPDINSSKEAEIYVKNLIEILLYIETCKCDMSKGNLRIDINISLGEGGMLGDRVEIKNVNSIKFMSKAIDYEIERQNKILDVGKKVVRETRGFDDKKMTTFSMRLKETELDYRYISDPDIPDYIISSDLIDKISKTVVELPEVRKKRLEKTLGYEKASLIVREKKCSDLYDQVSLDFDEKEKIKIANWFIANFYDLNKSDLTTHDIVFLFKKFFKQEIDFVFLSETFKKAFLDGKEAIYKTNFPQRVEDKILETEIQSLLDQNQSEVLEYKKGKKRVMGFFVGQIVKKFKGKVDPKRVSEILAKKIN